MNRPMRCFLALLISVITSLTVAAQDGREQPIKPSASTTSTPLDTNKKSEMLPPSKTESNTPPTTVAKDDLKCEANHIGAWFLMVFLALINWFGLGIFYQKLSKSDWKLSDALSEKSEGRTQDENPPQALRPPAVSATATGGAGVPPAGAPLPASSSRLISIIGSFALLTLFLATSFYVVWALFTCQPLDRLDKVGTFILYGAALFAPYATNKISEMLNFRK